MPPARRCRFGLAIAAALGLLRPAAASPPPAEAATAARLEVPPVVRLDGGSLGEERIFVSSPIRFRLGRISLPPGRRLVVRLMVVVVDERWSGAEVRVASASARGGVGLAGPLVPGVPTPVFRTAAAAGEAEAEIAIVVRAPARRLGAGPRALRLDWDVAEEVGPEELSHGVRVPEPPGALPPRRNPGVPGWSEGEGRGEEQPHARLLGPAGVDGAQPSGRRRAGNAPDPPGR